MLREVGFCLVWRVYFTFFLQLTRGVHGKLFLAGGGRGGNIHLQNLYSRRSRAGIHFYVFLFPRCGMAGGGRWGVASSR